MRKVIGLLGALTAAGALIGLVPGGASGASTYVCTRGLMPGSYPHVHVPAGAICRSNGGVTVSGGVSIAAGATFVLGTDQGGGGSGGGLTSTIVGGVRALNAANVQIHSTIIFGGLSVEGGSGPFGGPFGITWNAIEDNHIIGGATVEGYSGFWFGFIRNLVRGDVNLNNNVVVDEDGNEYVTNAIIGNLNCSGNSPAPQIGDSEGKPNRVTGLKTGQCVNV